MNQDNVHVTASAPAGNDDAGLDSAETLGVLRSKLVLLTAGPLLAGLLAFGATYLIAPTFTASTTFMPPQQAPSGAAAALASLGSLAGLAGGAGVSSSGDRYVALMQSVTVSDRLIDHFKLMTVYDTKFRVDARRELAINVRISLGKKDGLVTVDVDDTSPQRAADIANRYVDELRRITSTLAVTEAQQRREFFERHLQQTRDRLAQAQRNLESSGFNPGALKAEPKAAAEAYARLRAEATAAGLRLSLLRSSLADGTPEIKQQQALLTGLREQLARAERATDTAAGPDYVGKYREFKYQETLFDVYARQFELARADESREGALIQVVDPANAPERKSKPKRVTTAGATAVIVGMALIAWTLFRRSRRPHVNRHSMTALAPTS